MCVCVCVCVLGVSEGLHINSFIHVYTCTLRSLSLVRLEPRPFIPPTNGLGMRLYSH